MRASARMATGAEKAGGWAVVVTLCCASAAVLCCCSASFCNGRCADGPSSFVPRVPLLQEKSARCWGGRAPMTEAKRSREICDPNSSLRAAGRALGGGEPRRTTGDTCFPGGEKRRSGDEFEREAKKQREDEWRREGEQIVKVSGPLRKSLPESSPLCRCEVRRGICGCGGWEAGPACDLRLVDFLFRPEYWGIRKSGASDRGKLFCLLCKQGQRVATLAWSFSFNR